MPLPCRSSGWMFAALSFLVVCACGSRTPISEVTPLSGCDEPAPTCVAPHADDACGQATVVTATCNVRSRLWRCPAGARPYARAEADAGDCRPFAATNVHVLGGWGLSALTQVPTDDGRCLWIADSATLADGSVARNVAFEPDPSAPYGSCPTTSLSPPTPIVTVEGGDDPSVLVQINGAFRISGVTHVLYRVFRSESGAVFGAVEVGGGVGRWDATRGRVVIPTVTGPFPWGLDLDLGDASLVAADGAHAYVWGCARPGMKLAQGCELARLDSVDVVELLTTSGTWLATTDASLGAVLFGSGSWSSSVVATATGLEHVYVGDFGSVVASHVAATVAGPWSDGPAVVACNLPLSDDPMAFCAGPIVHGALSDPTRPGELALTYGIGSSQETTPLRGTAADYWPRFVVVR